MFSEFFDRKKEKMEMRIERYKDLAHGDPVTPHNAIESVVASTVKSVKDSSSGSSFRNFLGRSRRGSIGSSSSYPSSSTPSSLKRPKCTPITRLTYDNEAFLFEILKSPLEDPYSRCNSGTLDFTSKNSGEGRGEGETEDVKERIREEKEADTEEDSDSEEEEVEQEEGEVKGKGYSLRSSRSPTSPALSLSNGLPTSSSSSCSLPPSLPPFSQNPPSPTPSLFSPVSTFSPPIALLNSTTLLTSPSSSSSSSSSTSSSALISPSSSSSLSLAPSSTETQRRKEQVQEESLVIPFGRPINSAYVSTILLYNDETYDDSSAPDPSQTSQGEGHDTLVSLLPTSPLLSPIPSPFSSLSPSLSNHDTSLLVPPNRLTLAYVDAGAYDVGVEFVDDKDLEHGMETTTAPNTFSSSSASASSYSSASLPTFVSSISNSISIASSNTTPLLPIPSPYQNDTHPPISVTLSPSNQLKHLPVRSSSQTLPIPTLGVSSEPSPPTPPRASRSATVPIIFNTTPDSPNETGWEQEQRKISSIADPYAYLHVTTAVSREGSRENSPRSDDNMTGIAGVRCTASKPISASSSPLIEPTNADEESCLTNSAEISLLSSSEPLFFGGFGGQLHCEAEQRLIDSNRQHTAALTTGGSSTTTSRFMAGVRETYLPSSPVITAASSTSTVESTRSQGYVLEAETNLLSNFLSPHPETPIVSHNSLHVFPSPSSSPVPSPSPSPRIMLSPQTSFTNLVSSATFKPTASQSYTGFVEVPEPSPQINTLRSSTFSLPTRRPAPPTPNSILPSASASNSSETTTTSYSSNVISPGSGSTSTEPKSREKKRVVAIPEVDDWNGRFQRCVRGVQKSSGEQERLKDSFRKLISVSQDFLHSAKTYGKIIVDERELHEDFKTIKPLTAGTAGMIGGEKYFVANIIFKFALGGPFLKGFTDEIAAKVAGHELKGLLSYYNSGIKGIHVPLVALLDYRGYRLLAISRLPVSGTTLKYGTADGAKTIHNELSEKQIKRLKQAANYIHIKSHFCRNQSFSQMMEMYSPCDLEGHIGHDGRFYVLDFSRVMPPVAPVAPAKRIPCAHLYRLFRPEFVQQYPKPLCSDGFSGFIKGLSDADQHNRELLQATKVLLQRVIPETASLLSNKVLECITFGEALDQFPLVRLIHTQGVNLRNLPLLRFHSHVGKVRGLLMIEMIARTLKQWIRRDTREEMKRLCVPLEAPYKELMLNRLNIIFGNPTTTTAAATSPQNNNTSSSPPSPSSSSSQVTNHFWQVTLREMMNSKYSGDGPVFLPSEVDPLQFDLRHYVVDCLEGYMNGMVLLSTKVTSMLKIKLGAMLLKFLQKYPSSFNLCDFVPLEEVDIRSMGIRIKHMNLVAHAEGYLLRLRGDDQRIANEPKKAVLLAAYAKLEEALNTDPRNKYTLRNCAIVLFTMYRHLSKHHLLDTPELALLRKAESYFRDALKIDPKDPFSRYHYAEFLLKTSREGDPDNERRETEFLRVLREGPSDPLILGMYYQFLLMHFNSRTETIKRVHERLNRAMDLRARTHLTSDKL